MASCRRTLFWKRSVKLRINCTIMDKYFRRRHLFPNVERFFVVSWSGLDDQLVGWRERVFFWDRVPSDPGRNRIVRAETNSPSSLDEPKKTPTLIAEIWNKLWRTKSVQNVIYTVRWIIKNREHTRHKHECAAIRSTRFVSTREIRRPKADVQTSTYRVSNHVAVTNGIITT